MSLQPPLSAPPPAERRRRTADGAGIYGQSQNSYGHVVTVAESAKYCEGCHQECTKPPQHEYMRRNRRTPAVASYCQYGRLRRQPPIRQPVDIESPPDLPPPPRHTRRRRLMLRIAGTFRHLYRFRLQPLRLKIRGQSSRGAAASRRQRARLKQPQYVIVLPINSRSRHVRAGRHNRIRSQPSADFATVTASRRSTRGRQLGRHAPPSFSLFLRIASHEQFSPRRSHDSDGAHSSQWISRFPPSSSSIAERFSRKEEETPATLNGHRCRYFITPSSARRVTEKMYRAARLSRDTTSQHVTDCVGIATRPATNSRLAARRMSAFCMRSECPDAGAITTPDINNKHHEEMKRHTEQYDEPRLGRLRRFSTMPTVTKPPNAHEFSRRATPVKPHEGSRQMPRRIARFSPAGRVIMLKGMP